MGEDRLQDGIYFRGRERPAPCYRLLILNLAPGVGRQAARDALGEVMGLLAALRVGHVRELSGLDGARAGHIAEQYSGLRWLVGIGRRLFDERHHRPSLSDLFRPAYLAYLRHPEDAFPALPWSRGGTENLGEGDLALQLTADREAAVNCAAVEIWKLIVDRGMPLIPVASFAGFGRYDGRGWLEFHDGVSNIPRRQRRAALEARGDPEWMRGGSYMAFLRLAVDLEMWRTLTRAEQELLVGRDKLTGSPIVEVERSGSNQAAQPVFAPPLSVAPSAEESAVYEDPPQATDPAVEASHIHRVNQNRASSYAAGGLRIFRQGYDFLDSIGPHGPRLGLNFVSFQRDLASVQHILRLPGWLGDVNFGGRADASPGEPQAARFTSLNAGGLYAVPPQRDPFPGVELFAQR
jgi:Dyp-type peroxidase family